MKHTISGIFLVFFFTIQNLQAQEISKLTVPASPAFSILDFEPSAVMRPTNARSLAGDILNSFDKDGKLLLNLGLEVAPYWLKSHPNLTRETYLRPNMTQTFLQSFSLSAATVKDSVSGSNRFSTGFRFRLYNGEPVKELETASAELKTKTMLVAIINGIKSVVGADIINTRQKAIDAIVKALTKKNVLQQVIDNIQKEAEVLSNNYTDSVPDIIAFLDQLINDRIEAYSELAQKVSDLLYVRKGFMVEFAGAMGFNSSKKNDLDRTGFWGNVSYYVSPDDLFTLTARYMFKNNDSVLTNFDAGLGFLKKTINYNISVEAMIRHFRAEIPDTNISNQPIKRIEKDFTYRFAVQGSYVINKYISINLSLGKDFNSPFVSGSGFFSIVGFNYSIFSKEPGKLK